MPDRTTPEPPQFPAGPFVPHDTHGAGDLHVWTDELERAPERLRRVVSGLSDEQLATTYKNWTIRQITHHLADSHLNAYIRCKLALTEAQPTVKPYDESLWSRLADAQHAAVESSLQIIGGLHARWTHLLRSLPDASFERAFYHPESREVVPLWRALASYAWHGRHHTAQIEWVRSHKL
ncbi:MAG TPA: putative metal-dependent hydrolase [bacterium]|nr:putative metal-dependent hydrolase [bacterium]